MGLLDAIVGGGVGKLVKDVVGTWKLSPEAKLEFDRAIAENEFKLKQLDAELEAKLADAASTNIRAEAASDNWVSKTCRPLYILLGAITIWANIWLAWISRLTAHPVDPVPIPDMVYQIFIVGFCGYVGARTVEKLNKFKG